MLRTILAVAAAAVLSSSVAAQDYPARDIQGTIMWGAGGATDNLARVVTPVVEAELGQKIVLVNRPGGAGAVSTQYVHSRPADGYNILYGAETPQIHQVLGLSKIDYDAFSPLVLFGRNLAVFVVKPDAPWKTMGELVADIKARPGKITAATTGPGATPAVALGILRASENTHVNQVPFDGEGPGLTALQGGHADFMPTSLPAATELLKSGRLPALAVLDLESPEAFPDIPPITKDLPGTAKYLPWGTFQGVFVKADTPSGIVARLTDAFLKATKDPRVVEFVKSSGMVPMNTVGAEARAFINNWKSMTSWLLYDIGDAKISPAEFDIPRP